MSSRDLSGWRILVAEDEVLLADDLAEKLEEFGAEVLGPAYTAAQAEALIETEAGERPLLVTSIVSPYD